MADATPISLEDLVEDTDLIGISTFQLAAERVDEPSEVDDGAELDPTHILHIDTREDGSGFRVKVETQIEMPIGRIVATVGAAYQLNTLNMSAIDREILMGFVNNVAVMTLIPYIRQAIGDITLRVFDSALLMPMMKRGELWFDEGPDATATDPADSEDVEP